MESKIYARTLASLQVPFDHFLKTGFFDVYTVEGYETADIPEQIVRGRIRRMAKELKRPFIRCHPVIGFGEWRKVIESDGEQYKYFKHDEARFEWGFVEMPKRKYLMPLIAPLLLAAPEAEFRYHTDDSKPVQQYHSQSLWEFKIFDRQFWNQYYDFVLNDPDCRKARGLTP